MTHHSEAWTVAGLSEEKKARQSEETTCAWGGGEIDCNIPKWTKLIQRINSAHVVKTE